MILLVIFFNFLIWSVKVRQKKFKLLNIWALWKKHYVVGLDCKNAWHTTPSTKTCASKCPFFIQNPLAEHIDFLLRKTIIKAEYFLINEWIEDFFNGQRIPKRRRIFLAKVERHLNNLVMHPV